MKNYYPIKLWGGPMDGAKFALPYEVPYLRFVLPNLSPNYSIEDDGISSIPMIHYIYNRTESIDDHGVICYAYQL